MSMLPQDPYLLLSVVNTKLLDEFDSLEELCQVQQVDMDEMSQRLAAIGYRYIPEQNRFGSC